MRKTITLEAYGQKKTIEQWAEEKGLNHKTLYGRWIRTKGRPTKLTKDQANHMFRNVVYVPQNVREQFRVIYPDGIEMTIAEIIKKPWCEIKRTAAERRFTETTGPMHREDFKIKPKKQKADIGKRTGGPSREWLKMSGKKNTGRGCGEISNDEWANLAARGLTKINFSALGI